MPGDLQQYADIWDAQALDAFQHYYEVAQPLAQLIRPEFQDKVEIAAKEQRLVDSIRAIHFDRDSKNVVK